MAELKGVCYAATRLLLSIEGGVHHNEWGKRPLYQDSVPSTLAPIRSWTVRYPVCLPRGTSQGRAVRVVRPVQERDMRVYPRGS